MAQASANDNIFGQLVSAFDEETLAVVRELFGEGQRELAGEQAADDVGLLLSRRTQPGKMLPSGPMQITLKLKNLRRELKSC